MEGKLKTQIGTSISADFGDSTWTFEMDNEFTMKAGTFAIVPIDEYNSLINKD